MSQRKWIRAVLTVLLSTGTILFAQAPILDFDKFGVEWTAVNDDPASNVFLLADTTDAHQGAGSMIVWARFRGVHDMIGSSCSAAISFPSSVNLAGADEIRFWIKIVQGSIINRSLQLTCLLWDKPAGATGLEAWQYGPDYDMLYAPDDGEWHLMVIPFSRLALVPGTSSVNGVFDKGSVTGFGFKIRSDGSAPDSIRFLIDDLVATKTVKEFQLVSFDDVNPTNGWQSNELNPWELTIDTEDKVEGTGSLDVMMDIREFEDWGAEAEVGWGFEAPGINLTGITELRCRVKPLSPPTLVHATRFYFWFMDQPAGEPNGEVWTTNPTYSVMIDEDKIPGAWSEVVVPMDQFMFASWNADNGTVNNEVFDLDAIVSVNLNVGADNPPGEPDAVEFLIDDLWATTGDASTVDVSGKNVPGMPADFRLDQNYPNPFNPSTTLHFQLPRSGEVTLKVVDCRGKVVKTVLDAETRAQGIHSVQVDLSGQPSGIYFCSLELGGKKLITKMTLMK